MTGDKLRFRFEKTGVVRLLSHHDLMRCLERMLRRADLPVKHTAGFSPGPRVVFALSLPLGVAGRDEIVDIEFTAPQDPDDVLARLNAQAPGGLRFARARAVPMKATAVPRCMAYRLPLPADRAAPVAARCRELLASDKVWVDRYKPTPRTLNIRPYLRDLRVDESGLTLDLWVTSSGTARADELSKLIGVDDLVEAGAVLERAELEVHDEAPPPADPADAPPTGPADTRPLDRAAVPPPAKTDDAQPAGASWGASPNGPVVE